jgi:glycosyltransferase involved in cell wall biosynthesis
MTLKIDMNPNKTKISIVIPVYNSEDTIESLVLQLIAELSNYYSLEIVLVNDDSRDDSENRCINLYNQYPSAIRFYSLAKNFGEHNAVMAGLNHVSGDYIVIMDDDFQNPISEVIKLVKEGIKTDNDVIYTFYEKKRDAFWRNACSWFNDRVANIMLEKPKDLYLSSFKLLNKFLVQEIVKYELPFPYIDGLIVRTTNKIGKIKVEHQERLDGTSGYTVRKLIRLWLNMFTNFSILPLRVSILIGFIFSFIGLLLGINTVFEKMTNPDLPLGWASMIVITCIFAGVQLIALGMIGEYVGRIFLSQNKKPQFTVRKAYEMKSLNSSEHLKY